MACRLASTHHVSKNIEVICQDDHPPIMEKYQAQAGTTDRPLLILLSWLFSKRKHVMKFANIYMEQGFDVVAVYATPWQLMWPVKGTRVSKIIKVLKDKIICLMINPFIQLGYC